MVAKIEEGAIVAAAIQQPDPNSNRSKKKALAAQVAQDKTQAVEGSSSGGSWNTTDDDSEGSMGTYGGN